MERGQFTDEVKRVFLDAIERGEPLETAARASGASRSTVYYWLRTSPVFMAAVEAAVEKGKANRKGPRHRVVLLTPELGARIIALATEGASRAAIGREAGLGARTLLRWVARGLAGEPPYRQFVLDLSAAEQGARRGPTREPKPASPPPLALVPKSKAEKASRARVDTRTAYRKEVTREAIRAAGIAIADVLEPAGKGGARVEPGTVRRFDHPESWAVLRQQLHVLAADARASALAALTMEHIEREEQAAGLAWTPHGSVSRSEGDG